MPLAVKTDFEENVRYLNETLGVGKSYDVIYRRYCFGDVELATYVINGFFQSIVNLLSQRDLEYLAHDDPAEPAEALRDLIDRRLHYSQVTTTTDMDTVVKEIMSGPMAIIVSGSDKAILVDTRYYPDRKPSEPDTEQLVRGPQDGFVETIIYNTALIRRRVRDPRLRFEMIEAGSRSKMDIALTYIEGLTSPELVEHLRRKLKSIGSAGLSMAEQPVAEHLSRRAWNPFPTVRFTQRPDVAAFNLMEGHALIVVDTTPEVIIAPSTLWNHIEHPEDYHVSPPVGTYLRWLEFASLLLATVLGPLWLLVATHPALLAHDAPGLKFLGPKQVSGFPLFWQFVFVEIAIDVLRRAILNTPHPMASTMGILGAVILGQLAAKAGIFAPEVLVYMVVAAVANFAISSNALGETTRLARFSLIILVGVGGLYGFWVGVAGWFVLAALTDSFGVPYLWPLIPFNWMGMRDIVIRQPATSRSRLRPAVLDVLNRTRKPGRPRV